MSQNESAPEVISKTKQAINLVMEMYQCDRLTAIELYWDEVEAAYNLIDKGALDEDV